MLKIKTDKGFFEHSADFSLQIDETSPVMNDRGSQTVPATVPATPRNALITGFPFRLDATADPFDGNSHCQVLDGVYQRRGVINLVSASRSEGITFNIGFDNAEAYSKWSNSTLREIAGLPVIEAGSVENLATLINRVLTGEASADFAVFPIVVELDESTADDGKTKEISKVVFLNKLRGNDSVEWEKRTVVESLDGTDTQVTLPDGYGVTGFLYVWRILELIFAGLELSVVNNPFKDGGELQRLVALNNCADAICTGSLHYADLMPDCTPLEFLEALHVRFGLVYCINYNSMSVDLRLIKDILNKESQCEWIEQTTDFPMFNFETPKYITLSAGTSFEGAAPQEERFEDFIKGVDTSRVSVSPQFSTAFKTPLIYTTLTGEWFKYDALNEEYKSSGSSFFNWDPATEGLDAESLTSADEWVPMKQINGEYYPLFLAGTTHRHSFIKGYANEDGDTPLSFLWAFVAPTNFDHAFGSWSPIVPDSSGANVQLLDGVHRQSLLFQFTNGLFYNYWREYDEILRHGFISVNVPLSMTLAALSTIDLLTPQRLGGQTMLIDKMSYSLPAKSRVDVDMTFRTVRCRGDYNITLEQNVPAFGPTSTNRAWSLKSMYLSQALVTSQRIALAEFNSREDNVSHGIKGASAECVSSTFEGHITWRDDPELLNFWPEYKGQELERWYKCSAVYDIYTAGSPGLPYTKVRLGSIKCEVSYKVILVALILNKDESFILPDEL